MIMSDIFGPSSACVSDSETSLRDILRNCANIQSYETLPIEDFNDNSSCLITNISEYMKMISSKAYSISGSSSNYASSESISDSILEENGRISLAYENLRNIPRHIADKFAAQTKFLDLSHNKFHNLSFLAFFEDLHTLILDRNGNLDVNTFPYLPNLRILWINNCDIRNITDWIHRIAKQCPELEHLSVMGNPGIKSAFNYFTPPAYGHVAYTLLEPTTPIDYREYILSVLSNLKYLNGVSRHVISAPIHTICTASMPTTSNSNQSTTSSTTSNENCNSDNKLKDGQKSSPTLNFKRLFQFRQRKQSFHSSSTN